VNFLIENLVLGLLGFCDSEFVTDFFFPKILYAKWRKFATKKSLQPTWQLKKSEFATWLPKKTATKLKAEFKFGEFLSPQNNLKIWRFFSQRKTRIQRQNIPLLFLFFYFWRNFALKKTLLLACC
jgi:hypothetical protein